jgi:hypothetical protein
MWWYEMRMVMLMAMLTILTGCWCGVYPEDKTDVSDYLSGCLDAAKNGKN